MTSAGKAIVAGATGMIGGRLTARLVDQGWQVVGLCRNLPATKDGATYLSVDLLDRTDCRAKISPIHDATHVFYTARADHREDGPEPVAENLDMLVNVVETAAEVAPQLQHVHVSHGAKYYGQHLGPYKNPARETQARHPLPNFYYDQQDYIERRAGPWTWSIARPSLIYDFAPGRARNLISLIAVYAEIFRELGLPLNFPGSEATYRCLTECADVAHVIKAIVWMSTHDNCANQAFNITNGDLYRWENIWPEFATYFGLAPGAVSKISLADTMADKGPVWDRIVEKHNLEPTRFEDMALWPYGDFVFSPTHDIVSDTTKARQFGFHDVVDTHKMFIDLFDRYRQARLIP